MAKSNEVLDRLLEGGILGAVTVASSGIPLDFPDWVVLKPGEHMEGSFHGFSLSSPSLQRITSAIHPQHVYSAMVIPSGGEAKTVFLSRAFESFETQCGKPTLNILQQRAMEAIPDILILKDPSGNWIHSNSTARRLLNETDSSPGSAPALSPDCPESDQLAWKSETHVRRDETLPDGSIFDVTKTALRNPDGSPYGLVVLARNVTEARRREAAQHRLRQTLETLRAVDRAVLQASSPKELLDSVTEALASSGVFSACGGQVESFEGYPAAAVQIPSQNTTLEESITHGARFYGILEGQPCSFTEDGRILLRQAAHEIGRALRELETSAVSNRRREFLNAFLEHLPGPAFIRDSSSVYLRVNGAFKELFAGTDWVGKDPQEIYQGESLEFLKENDRKVLREGYVTRMRLIDYDPSNPRNIETHYFRIDLEGGEPLVGGVGIDVTDKVRIENELRRSEERYRAIIRAIPDFIFIISTSGTYMDYLSGEDSLLAIGRNDIIGRSIADIGLSEEKSSEVLEALSAALNTGTVQKVEYTLDLMGDTHTYQASIAPFQKDMALALCRDITEERELEAKVMHVQKLESLGVLAGGIAHDFNNILMAVTGNVHLARQALARGKNPDDYLEIVEKAASRASGLAGQMLAYAGRGDFTRGPVSINATALEITEILGASVSKKASFEFNLDPNLPMVMADENQLRQVIMNLLTNASEALEEDAGRITVSTGVRYCDEDYLATLSVTEALKPGCYAWIEVKDTGKGMDADTLSRIFDPFFTTKFAGRGLGLSAVLGIMGSHGGGMGVSSRPGGGSCFRALFPVSSCNEPLEDEPFTGSSGWKGSGTVLFIDDEPVLRAVALEMIGDMGFSVVTAADGMEGLDLYRELQGEIVLVVTDLTMPRMDGDRLMREIRRQGSAVPVIVSSGYSASEILSRFPEDPPDGFLKKPYSASEMQGKIKSLLSSS